MSSHQLDREIATYEARTPRSKALQEEASRYLPGGSSRGTAYFEPYPFFADRGEGHYVYDVDGNRYLDFMINASSLVLGHAYPAIVEALGRQAGKGLSFSVPVESQLRLARLISQRVPSVDTVRFCNSGTEATLNVIRAARAFTGRRKFAKFEGGYHGSQDDVSVSVSTPVDSLDPAGPTAVPEFPGFPPSILQDVVVLPYNDLEGCERAIRQHADDLACVLVEPVMSNIGYVPSEREFLEGLRRLTKELGVLLAFDEVQTLRLAAGGAQELLGVTPDLTAFGKTIGGGMPAGAFGGRHDVMAVFDPTGGGPLVGHSGTFNANPMTMVAGETAMELITPEVYQRMTALGDELREKMQAVFDEFDVPAQVTGIGSLFGVNFTDQPVRDYRSALTGDRARARTVFMGLLNEGVLVRGGCGGALNILTTEAEVDTLVDATRKVMARVR